MSNEKLSSKIEEAKALGLRVSKLTLGAQSFVVRSVTRQEFNNIQKEVSRMINASEIDPSEQTIGEELMIEKCILEPSLSRADLVHLPAGYVSRVANLIMEISGFNEDDVGIIEEL